MPGPALHHIIAEQLKQRILTSPQFSDQLSEDELDKLRTLLSDPSNFPYLFLGCQGPDFFFFNTKDMNPALGKFVEMYFKVTDFIDDFVDTLKSVVPQPVLDALDAIEEGADEVIDNSVLLSELEQTFSDINNVLSGLLALLMEAVKDFISQFDLFDFFDHPYRDGVGAGEKWWWFDALHYRHTGSYAQALLEKTKDMDNPLHLYALGYLTHVAGDTVGHPYVNIMSGGAYRSHSQRHKTGENYHDVFNMQTYDGLDFNHSVLHALYNFNFNGTILTEDDVHFADIEPDPDTNLPNDLASLIASTINEVYDLTGDNVGEYGSALNAADVNNTYRLWFKWFRSTTETGTLPEPVPYSFSEEIREIFETAADNLEDIGDFIEDAADAAGDIGGLLGLLLFLAVLIIAAVAAAAAIADAIAGGLVTLTTSVIRAAAALIYEHVYNAYQSFRLGVALNGLAFPMTEHLSDPILRQFTSPNVPDPIGRTGNILFPNMPKQRWTAPLEEGIEGILGLEDHLIYPITPTELERSIPCLTQYLSEHAMFYINGDIPYSEGILQWLVNLANAEADENAIRRLNIAKKAYLGNALVLSGKLYDEWKKGLTIPNFNLDADRGYGYVCWTQTIGGAGDTIDFPQPLITSPNVSLKFLRNE